MADWSTMMYLAPGDFTRPDDLDPSVVWGLDRLASRFGVKPIVLDDVSPRPNNPGSQHPKGTAIDFTFPTIDSVQVMNAIEDMKFFTGYGMYVNEKGAVSFHVDRRSDRTPDNPATWGAWKDRDRGIHHWQYTGLQTIVDQVKKKSRCS